LLSTVSMEVVPPSELSTSAYRTFGFFGKMARPMRPSRDGRPVFSFVQVAPPSVVR
jgi:hypothetical protein